MFSYTKNKLYHYKDRKKLYIRQLSDFYCFESYFEFLMLKNAEMTKLMPISTHFANFNHL
jgi:hypothetical protein